MRIAIDTCAPVASFAVAVADGPVVSIAYTEAIALGERLLPELARVMSAVGPSCDVAEIVVTVGPGSFTGQRLGVAIAQGLKVASPHARCFAVTALEALAVAHANRGASAVSVVADAKRGAFYWQDVRLDGTPSDACALVTADALAGAVGVTVAPSVPPTILACDAVAHQAATEAFPSATILGLGADVQREGIASSLFAAPQCLGLESVEKIRPLYLRAPDAAPARPAGLRA